MKQDEIIEMARQAGFARYMTDGEINWKMYEAFAKLVAAKEREACASMVECEWGNRQEKSLCDDLAKMIRARGEA